LHVQFHSEIVSKSQLFIKKNAAIYFHECGQTGSDPHPTFFQKI